MAANNNGMSQREIVNFSPNVPVQVATKWPEGKIIATRNGNRVMFSLQDGRVMFVDMDTAAKIDALDLRAGEPFSIRKTVSGRRGDIPTWEVWRDGERYVEDDVPEPEPPSEMCLQLDASIREVQSRKGIMPVIGANASPLPRSIPPAPVAQQSKDTQVAERSRTKLEDALKTVVAAVHSANEYAKSIGYAIPQFTSEDIRCMANTLMIEGRK